MKRLGHVLNALILFIGGRIAWYEWRHPERVAAPAEQGSANDRPDSSASEAGSDTATTATSTETGGGLAERQSVAAEARFSPAFRNEIEAEEGPTAAADETPAQSAAGSAEPDAESGDETPMWAGEPAADTPTARDLELASPEPHGSRRAVPDGALVGDGSATCPPDHPIKGNASSMIYHQPGQPSYERTVAEFCFDSVESAEEAGYRAPKR